MILNQTAEYALRAMAVLSTSWLDGRVTSSQLAKEANIPRHYISKVMRRLVLAGLAQAKRGHRGGFELSRPPEEISFMDVLEAVDFKAEGLHCAFGLGQCSPDQPCALHPAYSALSDSFNAWARTTTFAVAQAGAPALPTDAAASG